MRLRHRRRDYDPHFGPGAGLAVNRQRALGFPEYRAANREAEAVTVLLGGEERLEHRSASARPGRSVAIHPCAAEELAGVPERMPQRLVRRSHNVSSSRGAFSVDAIEFTTVSNPDEVSEILELQARNLPSALTPRAMATEGFVTVRHDAAVLRRMNEAAPAIIAKAAGRVVGYALVMPRSFADAVPILRPFFDRLDTLSWKGAPLRGNPRWFVMGQICIAHGYRSIGIFDGLYRTVAGKYGDRFDFTVTEVAARNTRSLRAHLRVGFETLHVYSDASTGEEWHVIALDLA